MMKTDLVEQKSMLAKLMAAENISVEHKKIPTAAFDIKNRVLYLPILKWKPGSNVYDLFCAHEVGHALWTPEEGWHSSVSAKGKGYKSFLNVIEDARIDKKIKRKFAGARKCMAGGYNELMDEDFFGLRKMGVIPNDLGLIDRINLYTKAGSDYGVEFSDEEREWVEKVERTETWEDVVEVTDALYEWCKENESETDNSYDEFDDDSEWNDDMTLMIMKIQKKMIQKMIQKKMVLLVQKVKKMIQKKMIQRKMVLLVQKVKNPKKQTILKGLQIILRVEKVTHMVIENFLLMKKKMTLPH